MMVGRLLSFTLLWYGHFSVAMLNFQGVEVALLARYRWNSCLLLCFLLPGSLCGCLPTSRDVFLTEMAGFSMGFPVLLYLFTGF